MIIIVIILSHSCPTRKGATLMSHCIGMVMNSTTVAKVWNVLEGFRSFLYAPLSSVVSNLQWNMGVKITIKNFLWFTKTHVQNLLSKHNGGT